MTESSSIEALPSFPGPSRSWAGVDMLQGGKGYVSAPLGQLHYRDVGPRDARATLLLFHQSPMSMVEFGAAQNSLAAVGLRAIATDTPGYGSSDQPDILPTIGGLADNFVHVLDHLGVEKAFVGGHHTGACIATALAARHPDRVAGVMLHGCPLYTQEEAETFKSHKEWDRAAKADGSHFGTMFRFNPDKPATEADLFLRTWMTITMFQQGPDIGHWAVNRYDMTSDFMKLACPGLIITEGDDVIHYMDKRARELRPDFDYSVLSETGWTGLMTNPDGWAKLAAEFIDRCLVPA